MSSPGSNPRSIKLHTAFAINHIILPLAFQHKGKDHLQGLLLTFTIPGCCNYPPIAFLQALFTEPGMSPNNLIHFPTFSHLKVIFLPISKKFLYYTGSLEPWSGNVFKKTHYWKHGSNWKKCFFFQERINFPLWEFPSYPVMEMCTN